MNYERVRKMSQIVLRLPSKKGNISVEILKVLKVEERRNHTLTNQTRMVHRVKVFTVP